MPTTISYSHDEPAGITTVTIRVDNPDGLTSDDGVLLHAAAAALQVEAVRMLAREAVAEHDGSGE